MLRMTKIALVSLVALWGLVGAIGNLMELGADYQAVRMVAAMEGIDGDSARSTDSPVIAGMGLALIIIGKSAAAIFCGAGAYAMARACAGTPEAFRGAKRMALVGCGAAVAMLFGGFAVIGESFFQMWQTPMGQLAGAGAFRYAGYIALIAIFVAQPE